MSAMENAYALVVGIANYTEINPLHCGYSLDNVTLLLDGEAIQAGLRQTLAALTTRADNRSTVFIYISSHGGGLSTDPMLGNIYRHTA